MNITIENLFHLTNAEFNSCIAGFHEIMITNYTLDSIINEECVLMQIEFLS